jgi:hypothetical protein
MQRLRGNNVNYVPFQRKGINKTLAKAPKILTARYLQLKTGHASVGTYLKRINAIEADDCWWCGAVAQDSQHLLVDCRKWRRSRRKLKTDLEAAGVTWPLPTTRRTIAQILSNEQAVEPLLVFLQNTEVGAREGAAERIREWGERQDREGEE